ncbi:hypothetical protein [Paraburkholderia sp. BCC1884]|uniref:hypothetical protein n=1 Tax=Paraburkholderia sp. BCC1884 TaxID=2562668 RepID=UPI001182673F|nr:hypothetical protein [Paraburkholderia sp. BCC1884]
MTNAINNFGNSMPFNPGETPMAAQNGVEINARFRTAPVFPPDPVDAGMNAGAMRPPLPAAQALGGAGFGGGMMGGGNGGAGMSGVMSQIMNVVQGLMSAVMLVAPPLLGMFGSMMGGAGAAGQGGQGTGAA